MAGVLAPILLLFLYQKQRTPIALEEKVPQETKTLEIVTDIPYQSPIDFVALKETNEDVVAWIRIDGTAVDEAVVHDEESNETYLKKDWTGKETPAGAIYLEMDNSKEMEEAHIILYGHNMKNGSKFHVLEEYKKKDFFDAHKKVTLFLPDREIHLRAFATLASSSDGIRRKTEFTSEEELEDYIEAMTAHADIYEMPEKKVTRLYSLITCSYVFSDARGILYLYEE